jgi:carbonic anhydrase
METKVTKVEIIYRYEARDTPPRPLPSNSNAALRRLEHGNRDFAALLDHVQDVSGVQQIIEVDPRDLGLMPGELGAPKQRPFAAILGCSDARVPIELIFNEGPNDLFVVRVAGNGLGPEVLGSLKYAVDNLGDSLKLIAVLGHSGCGALTAAVDVFLTPGDYLSLATEHSLRSILDRLLLVVQTSATKLIGVFGADVVRRQGYRKALIETSIVTHAALAAYSIQNEFGTSTSDLQTVFGVYLLETREVWVPRVGNVKGNGLAAAPRDLAAFVELGDAIVRSNRITSYISQTP